MTLPIGAGLLGGALLATAVSPYHRRRMRRFHNKVGRFFRPKQARNIARRQARRRKLRRQRRSLQTA